MIKRIIIGFMIGCFSIGCFSSGRDYQGSGFFINQMGDLVTARHMVSQPNSRFSIMYKNKEYKATLKAISNDYDIAILHVNIINDYSFKLRPLKKDNRVYILGFPLTNKGKIKLTAGFPLKKSQELQIKSNEITSCGGNSGGAVFDYQGYAVGVLVNGLNLPHSHCSKLSGAVPIDKVIKLAKDNNIILIPSLETDFNSLGTNLQDIIRGNGVVEVFELSN